jgi:acetolactate synthase-1/2/3 large subunit
MSAADLLLLYGNDPVEGPPNKWKYDAIPSVELTEHAFEFPLYKATVSVIGPIKDALGQLASSMKPQWSAGQLADFKQSIFTAGRVKKGAGVSPQDIIDAAIATLPADTRITIDAGAHMLPVLHLMRVAEPNQSLISRGLSTMGFAVPAAIASCLADPDRRTVAFTGDGGVMMCLGEFGTAMQEGAKPIVVVFNDSCLTLIGVKQHRRQLAPAGVGFVDADFAKIAAGFGWHTTRVDKAADLQGAFKAALASDKPALIDVLINPEEYEAQILALRG